MPDETPMHEHTEPTLYAVSLAIARLDTKLDGYQELLREQLSRTNDAVSVVKDEVGGIAVRVAALEKSESERIGSRKTIAAIAGIVGTLSGALGASAALLGTGML